MLELPSALPWPAPGLHRKIPAHVYHAHKAASCSILKILANETPADAKIVMDEGGEDKECFVFGDAFHAFLMEHDRFEAEYMLGPLVKSKAEKKWKEAEIAAKAEGKRLLTWADHQTLVGMKASLGRHTLARSIINAPGFTEVSLLWKDPLTGEDVKNRVDRLVTYDDDAMIVDLKSCKKGAASPRNFARECARFGYQIQIGGYRNGVAAVLGKLARFVLVAVEKSRPYKVAVHEARAPALLKSENAFRQALDKYHECNVSGNWHGYEEVIHELILPDFAYGSESDDVELTLDGAKLEV